MIAHNSFGFYSREGVYGSSRNQISSQSNRLKEESCFLPCVSTTFIFKKTDPGNPYSNLAVFAFESFLRSRRDAVPFFDI